MEWLSQFWDDFQSESVAISFVNCGMDTHRINGEKKEVDFGRLHGPLKKMLGKKMYIDNDIDLEEANEMFTEN